MTRFHKHDIISPGYSTISSTLKQTRQRGGKYKNDKSPDVVSAATSLLRLRGDNFGRNGGGDNIDAVLMLATAVFCTFVGEEQSYSTHALVVFFSQQTLRGLPRFSVSLLLCDDAGDDGGDDDGETKMASPYSCFCRRPDERFLLTNRLGIEKMAASSSSVSVLL